MRRSSKIAIVIGALLLAVGAFLMPPASLEDVFLNPLNLILGSHHQLTATLIDVSQADDMKSFGQRLLKPFGSVKLIKVYNADSKPSSSSN
jgi:hypothetical protein